MSASSSSICLLPSVLKSFPLPTKAIKHAPVPTQQHLPCCQHWVWGVSGCWKVSGECLTWRGENGWLCLGGYGTKCSGKGRAQFWAPFHWCQSPPVQRAGFPRGCPACPSKHTVFTVETPICEHTFPCTKVYGGMEVKFIGPCSRRSRIPWPNGLRRLWMIPDLKSSVSKEVPKPKIILWEKLIQRFLFQRGLHIRFLLLKGLTAQYVSFDDGNITLLPGFYFMFVFTSPSCSLQHHSWKMLITHRYPLLPPRRSGDDTAAPRLAGTG